MTTLLNGFELDFSASSFSAFMEEMPDPEPLRTLRAREVGQWFFYWRDGCLYALPEIEQPDWSYGKPVTLHTSDHRHLGLLAARINDRLPTKFPQYDALRRRPFAFLGKKDEIVSSVTARWRGLPDLVATFQVRPRFELDARCSIPVSTDPFLTCRPAYA